MLSGSNKRLADRDKLCPAAGFNFSSFQLGTAACSHAGPGYRAWAAPGPKSAGHVICVVRLPLASRGPARVDVATARSGAHVGMQRGGLFPKRMGMNEDLQRELRVLIVGESEQMRKLVREMLTLLGLHDIETATDAADALDRLRSKRGYDLVLADHEMEVATGIELLTLMRIDAAFKSIRFVLMTNGLSQAETDALRKAGEIYLFKPFNMLDLKSAIIAALLSR